MTGECGQSPRVSGWLTAQSDQHYAILCYVHTWSHLSRIYSAAFRPTAQGTHYCY